MCSLARCRARLLICLRDLKVRLGRASRRPARHPCAIARIAGGVPAACAIFRQKLSHGRCVHTQLPSKPPVVWRSPDRWSIPAWPMSIAKIYCHQLKWSSIFVQSGSPQKHGHLGRLHKRSFRHRVELQSDPF